MDKQTASTTIHSNNLIMVGNEFYMKNFKIKELLGDMWDKYERFNFNVISSWDTGTYPSLQLTISGLQWINLPLGEQAKIIISGTGDPIQYKNKLSNLFLKPSSPIVELKFSFMDMATRTNVNPVPSINNTITKPIVETAKPIINTTNTTLNKVVDASKDTVKTVVDTSKDTIKTVEKTITQQPHNIINQLFGSGKSFSDIVKENPALSFSALGLLLLMV